jgi:hypothetical protein
MVDVTLSCVLLWSIALSGEMANTTTVEAEVAPAVGGTGRRSTIDSGGRAFGATC